MNHILFHVRTEMKFQVHPKLKGENLLIVLLFLPFFNLFFFFCKILMDLWLCAFTHKPMYSSRGLV